ncbi:energy transducer TonB [Hydrogenophaga sp.]|uniref:energy transducer TonB n=1 Tax=Hydrogenophaga sp. TaxID=1904254 RepID=UPI003562AF19
MTTASALSAPPTVHATAPAAPAPNRTRLLIVLLVLGLHALGLWAMQNGLMRAVAEQVIPVQVMTAYIEPAQVLPTPAPAPTPAPPPPPQPVKTTPKPAVKPAPLPVPVATQPSERAPVVPVETAPVAAPAAETASPPKEASVQASSTTAAAASATVARVELPSSSAAYLNNPPPPYPPLSIRLNEQGKVIVKVFIDTSGTATQASIDRSSGYDRLDQTALQTALRWRYVPGKRGGVPEAMWFKVPVAFVLE